MTERGLETLLLGRKETHRSVKDLNHSIDLLHRVVEVEACARCSRYAEATHKRLVAMMAAAHGQPILIRKRGQIVRMRSVHDKPNKRAPLFLRTKDARSPYVREAVSRIIRKLRVVLENCRASDRLDVINCGCQSDRASNVRCASLKPVRWFLECALFERDAYDHFASSVPRRHGIQKLRASVKD